MTRENFSLFRKFNNIVTDDCYDLIKLEDFEGSDGSYKLLTIDNFEQGEYDLRFFSGVKEKFFTIKVSRGEYWESESFILKKTCLKENMQSA